MTIGSSELFFFKRQIEGESAPGTLSDRHQCTAVLFHSFDVDANKLSASSCSMEKQQTYSFPAG